MIQLLTCSSFIASLPSAGCRTFSIHERFLKMQLHFCIFLNLLKLNGLLFRSFTESQLTFCWPFQLIKKTYYDFKNMPYFLTSFQTNSSPLHLCGFHSPAAVDPLLTLQSLSTPVSKLRQPWEESAVHLFRLRECRGWAWLWEMMLGSALCINVPPLSHRLWMFVGCFFFSWTCRIHRLI